MSEAKPKVYVSAITCSDVIEEQGTRMLSALRISGGFVVWPTLRPTKDSDVGRWDYPDVPFNVVITFNSEAATSFRVGMRALTPGGEAIDLSEQQGFDKRNVVIGVASEGLTLRARGSVPGTTAGDYWIEILVDDETANRVPLRVVHPTENPAESPSKEDASDLD